MTPMFHANQGARRYSYKFWGNPLLVGGAIAVLLSMAGWLYFLGWLGWAFCHLDSNPGDDLIRIA
jgi:hypothetical protein